MRYDLQNDANLGYRERSIQQFDKMQEILKEEAEMLKSEDEIMLENLDLRLESSVGMFTKERDDSKALLEQEYQDKKHQVTKRLFTEIVKSSLPLNESLVDARADYINEISEDVYNALNENAMLTNYNNKGAWAVIHESITKAASNSGNSVDDCLVQVISECKNVIDGLMTRVETKIEKAVKLENKAVAYKEGKEYLKEAKTLFRGLTEHNYKICAKSELPLDVSLSEEALIRATVDYAILETINTSRMIDGLNYDHVRENFRQFR